MFIAQTGGYVRASNLGRQSHQVIALAATGQLGVAAAGQIRLAVVTTGSRRARRAGLATLPALAGAGRREVLGRKLMFLDLNKST